jgi:16S rRNA U516 pseudouridylate synthase RsuA-like enzyme
MSAVVRTTVYLDEEAYRRLQRLAKRRGRPAAELIREAVTEYSLRALPAGRPSCIGSGRSGRRDLAERSEDLLAGFGEER